MNGLRSCPRFLLSAASSGAGKTSWTMGLLKAFTEKGLHVQPFKAGPDYIDPGLHTLITGLPSRNLDTHLMDSATLRALFSSRAEPADLSLIEGVMGFYDSAGPRDASGSTWELAELLDTPVLLILDVKAAGASAAATALGFLKYREPSHIAGFLLNRVGSSRHLALVRTAIEDATSLPVLGYLEKNEDFMLPERHLGLVAGRENENFHATVEKLTRRITETCDLDRLLRIAREAPPLKQTRGTSLQGNGSSVSQCVRIAVARDNAFFFYYQDNLDFLEASGAELVFFSPLQDAALPEDTSGLYLGGGYPELHGQLLSENSTLRAQISKLALEGLPVFAECGGYMYLTEALVDMEGKEFPMVGFFRGKAVMGNTKASLGYYEGRVLTSTPFLKTGQHLKGHSFRWSSVEFPEGVAAPALSLIKPGEAARKDGQVRKAAFASYLHIHFASCPSLPSDFVKACEIYAKRNRT